MKLLLFSILTTVSLISGQYLSHDDAVAQLSACGIPIYSSAGCSDRNNPQCTSLDQVREATIWGVITLKKASDCDLTVTAGIEVGHATGDVSHWSGWKIDLRSTPCIQDYVNKNFAPIEDRPGDNVPQWQSGSGNIYALESNHWDIIYYNCGGC